MIEASPVRVRSRAWQPAPFAVANLNRPPCETSPQSGDRYVTWGQTAGMPFEAAPVKTAPKATELTPRKDGGMRARSAEMATARYRKMLVRVQPGPTYAAPRRMRRAVAPDVWFHSSTKRKRAFPVRCAKAAG